MLTSVGLVRGGGRFSMYGKEFLKIDRDDNRCCYIGYSRRGEAHGYAVELKNGIVVDFPIDTPCEVADGAPPFAPQPEAVRPDEQDDDDMDSMRDELDSRSAALADTH